MLLWDFFKKFHFFFYFLFFLYVIVFFIILIFCFISLIFIYSVSFRWPDFNINEFLQTVILIKIDFGRAHKTKHHEIRKKALSFTPEFNFSETFFRKGDLNKNNRLNYIFLFCFCLPKKSLHYNPN